MPPEVLMSIPVYAADVQSKPRASPCSDGKARLWSDETAGGDGIDAKTSGPIATRRY